MRASLTILSLLLFAGVAAGQPRPKPFTPPAGKPAVAAPARQAGGFINGVADTGQFLPDTTVLARVDERAFRAGEFVNAYFNSFPEFRPQPDSAGRAEFLTSMINKELLARKAREINKTLGFEDRLTMRTHTQRVLSNIVFQRLVSDSLQVTEDDVRRTYGYMKYDIHIRHILFLQSDEANRVRADLIAGRIKWEDAFRKYHRGVKNTAAGDLGWTTLVGMPPEFALDVFPLEPGQISKPLQDALGIQLVQVTERRPTTGIVPDYGAVRTMLRMQILGTLSGRYAESIQRVLRQRAGLMYDTTAMSRLAGHFQASNISVEKDQLGAPTMNISGDIPEFTPADTATIVARWKDGKLSFGGLVHVWSEITPVARPAMNTFEAMQVQVDALVLEPYTAAYAVERGLDKDSLAVAMIEQKREEILVKHLFADSIESRTWIAKADRQKYYKDHPTDFTTYPSVEFAALSTQRRSEADSLAARLRGGVRAEAILLSDSLAGIRRGSIQVRTANDHGAYQKLLFEELRPGQVSIEGPDAQGDFLVLQSRSFDPGRLLPYADVEGMIDESLQNIHQEKALNDMLARLRGKHRIETHLELLPRIKLVDSTLSN